MISRDELQARYTRLLTEAEFKELEWLEQKAEGLAETLVLESARRIDGADFHFIQFPSQYLINRAAEILNGK